MRWVNSSDGRYIHCAFSKVCDASFDRENMMLILHENDKHFTDHAYAKFGPLSLEEADRILSLLTEFKTV